jgi:hypothetical protein
MNDKLTDDNFMLFCASHYDNARYATTEEFYEDVSRIKYIKKLVTRYTENGELRERLILNHIIILNNCFGPENVCKILYFKLKPQMKYIKPFLILLEILPDRIHNVGDEEWVDTDLIEMDPHIVSKLRKV